MSIDPQKSQESDNTYFIDPENAAELARLLKQDALTTRYMGGIFPGGPDLSSMRDILDVACGPGGWVLDVAYANPKARVIGVDISRSMIEYAHMQAHSRGLENAIFQTMDILKPLDFADNSFDMVNARMLFAVVPRVVWPNLVQELVRITRPGGIVRLTETDSAGIVSSPAGVKLDVITGQALYRKGQIFSPDGVPFGMTERLEPFLKDAGCINIHQRQFVIDYSAGTEPYDGFCQNFQIAYNLARPLFIQTGATTQEEYEQLYQQMLVDMLADDFRAYFKLLSVWGEKPII